MRLKPVLFAIFCSLAALADAADPMESLTALRDAAIKNDIDAAMSFVVDKYTDEIIKTNKIPKELRDMLINLTGAFENTSVRAADAGRAEICATVRDKNGKDQSIRITMLLKDANFRFSTFSTQALPGAKIYLDEFLKALNEGDTAAAATYLTDELAKEFADGFPDALRLQCDNKVRAALFRRTGGFPGGAHGRKRQHHLDQNRFTVENFRCQQKSAAEQRRHDHHTIHGILPDFRRTIKPAP